MESLIHQGPVISTKSLRFNSYSTMNLITNLYLQQNIHTMPSKIHIHHITGLIITDQMGFIFQYLKPEWYNPKGIANTFSVNHVTIRLLLTLQNKTTHKWTDHAIQPSIFSLPLMGSINMRKQSRTSGPW